MTLTLSQRRQGHVVLLDYHHVFAGLGCFSLPALSSRRQGAFSWAHRLGSPHIEDERLLVNTTDLRIPDTFCLSARQRSGSVFFAHEAPFPTSTVTTTLSTILAQSAASRLTTNMLSTCVWGTRRVLTHRFFEIEIPSWRVFAGPSF